MKSKKSSSPALLLIPIALFIGTIHFLISVLGPIILPEGGQKKKK